MKRNEGKPSDFAEAIGPELRELPTPRASAELLARIQASRADGARVILPTDDARPRRRLVWSASAVAAAAVVVFTLFSIDRPEPGATDVDVPASWFGGPVAFAQTPPSIQLPTMRVTLASRLRPMAVVYARVIDSGGVARPRGETRLAVEHLVVDGTAAWRVVSSQTDATRPGWAHTDTVEVAATDLRLMRARIVESPYSRFSRISVTQHFDGTRLSGTMDAERGGVVAAHRTFDRVLASDAAPYVSDAFAPLFLMGVALDARWQGRASLLGWAVRDDNVFAPLEMRVLGEEKIRVPAGEFACWHLALEYLGKRHDYWVRKSDGLGVRSLQRTADGATREIRLVSVR